MDANTPKINETEIETKTQTKQVALDEQTSIEEVLPENTAVEEPILIENPKRFVLFPIQHDDIWAEYKKQEASIWTAEEIDLSSDLADWSDKLNDDERFFSKMFLHFLPLRMGL